MNPMEAELWERAIAAVRAGWCQYLLAGPGTHCALGAIGYAQWGFQWQLQWGIIELDNNALTLTMIKKLTQVILEQHPDFLDQYVASRWGRKAAGQEDVIKQNLLSSPTSLVGAFNDSRDPETGQAQVVAMMEKAAAL